MGVGAMTDFGALIAHPKTLFLGAAAQFGIFATLFGAIALNAVPGIEFTLKDASAIAIIGGADDTAEAKMRIMRECGIFVSESPATIGSTLADVLNGVIA
jgi:Na+-transporting methylmalonyl-CoA/oxaloacetate decarboxylase beta subunit